MKFFLKISRMTMVGAAVLLAGKPMAASSAVVQLPAVTIQNVTAGTAYPATVQYTTNLASPNWQTLGTLLRSTNLTFTGLPSVFLRGICSNLTVAVTLAWPASTNLSVVGYKLHYGLTSGAYSNVLNVGPATTTTIYNLAAGQRYYFAVTTYNASGVESPFSTETNVAFRAGFSLNIAGFSQLGGTNHLRVGRIMTANAIVPPPLVITRKVSATVSNLITLQFTTNLASPNWQTLGTFSGSTNLSFTNLPAVFLRGICNHLTTSATLGWQPSTDPGVVGYRLYYGVASHTYTHMIDVGPATTATISNLVVGTTYYFAATAYNSTGVQSSFSNEASATFQSPFYLTIGSH